MNGRRTSEMDSQEIRSSEAFLKTFKEPKNWKNWGITVAKVLREYMILIERTTGNMDFAEAAVVVQNSTCLYSKRVDEVYKILGDLLTSITIAFNLAFGGKRNSRNNDKADEGAPKKRKVVKPLEATDMQVLDSVASESTHNFNFEKLKKRQNHEVIFLNTNINPPQKPNTYCPIYQSDGQEICTKDKLRSLGFLSAKAVVDEVAFSNSELNRVADVNHTQSDDDCDISECRAQISFGGSVEAPMELEAEPSLLNRETPLPPFVEASVGEEVERRGTPDPSIQFPMAIDLNAVNLQPVVRLRKVVDWEEIPINFKLPSKKVLKVKYVFSLPPELIAINQKKGRKRKKIAEKNNEVAETTWLGFALQKGQNPVTDPVEHMALLEAKKRRELLAEEAKKKARMGQQTEEAIDPLLNMPPEDDLDDNGRDDFDLNPDVPGHDGESLLIPEADQVAEQEAYEESMRDNEFAQNLLKNYRDRKKMAIKAAEVAKKVAIWQESIEPKLKIAESRTKFDVKEYSQRILDKFPQNCSGEFLPFEHFVGGQPKHEIGRYFLSTLVMANTYNIEIRKSDPSPLAMDCLEMKLLSTTRRLSKNFGAGEDF